MKDFLKKFLVVFVVFVALLATLGAVNVFTTSIDNKKTYKNAYRWTGRPKDLLRIWAIEVEDRIDGTTGNQSIYFDPTDTAPTATEGRLYYNDTGNSLKLYNGSAWLDIDVSGASSLDTAYNAGSGITADDGAVAIANTDADTAFLLTLGANPSGSAALGGIEITNNSNSTENGIEFENTGSGDDIQGTGDNWAFNKAGLCEMVGLIVTTEDIQLENAGEIQNVVDTEIRLMENDEDWIFDFTTDGMTIKSGTGVVAVNWGDVDSHTGLNAIAFDGAVANTITQTGTGSADDLTISQATSAQDASLILQSSGTGTDALSLITSVADISLSSADNITRTAADDITDTLTDGGYTLTIGGASNGKYISTVADTYSMIAVDTVLIQNTEASKNITVDSVLGSIVIEGQEDAANAVLITADGGTNTTLKIHNDTGTGAQSLYILSDVGGITATASAGLVALNATGASAGDMTLTAGDNFAIAAVGTIGIQNSGAAQDVTIGSTLGSINIKAEEDSADTVLITADGGTNTTLKIFNDTGTGAASIYLLTDVGGITATASAGAIVLNATGASAGDYTATIGDEYVLTATGGIAITSTESAADAIGLTATTSAGGITLNAGTSNITFSGDMIKDFKREVEEITTATDTLTASESGTTYISSYTGTQTILLPDAAAGLIFTFIDGSSTAGNDLSIDPQSGDTIDEDTAGKKISSATDAYPQTITLIAEDGVKWWTKSRVGTWGQE